ncbi:MAG TPA: protein translocase subunit SecD [bacterium]|nr:protein translocase subunit SecD [bacterium]
MTLQRFVALAVLVLIAASVYAIYPPSQKLKLGLDIKGGLHMNLEVDESQMPGKTPAEISDAADRALEILRNRVDGLGVSEPVLEREGPAGIVIQLPGLTDIKRAKDILLSTAQLEFRLVSTEDIANYKGKDGLVDEKRLPKGVTCLPGKDGEQYLVEKTLLTGDSLVDAHVQPDQYGRPIVEFKLNADGGKKFGILTGDNIHRQLAIILDHRVYSAPTIQSRIAGGSGIITGSFTDEEARDLALVLRAGALPAPLKITGQFQVGPTLGADSVKKGTWAALLGLVLVLLFMGIYYGLSGWIANVGLLINMLFLLASLAGLQATLTLPGIAGIILTLGLSVDSNVLIFERIREELRLGKTIRAAIEAGYHRALVAIIDTHVTTLISAAVLFQFGTGPIKGFAVTLSLGVGLSLFTAVVVTKMIFDARKNYQSLSI